VPARILIVEDEALIAMELGCILEEMGLEVAGVACSQRAALDHISNARIDVALVDIHLADGPTGVEIGRKLAEQGVSVLYVTGNPSMIGQAPEQVIGVLAKPADGELVENAVSYALACREGRNVSPPPQLHLLR